VDGTKVHLFGVGDIEYNYIPDESCNLLNYTRSPTSPHISEHHKSYCSLERTHSTSFGSSPHWPHNESFRSLRRTSFPIVVRNNDAHSLSWTEFLLIQQAERQVEHQRIGLTPQEYYTRPFLSFSSYRACIVIFV